MKYGKYIDIMVASQYPHGGLSIMHLQNSSHAVKQGYQIEMLFTADGLGGI